MLALRDQENLVNAHQTAAASKPLNQGVKQRAPKTPGKATFTVPLNDENKPLQFGKGTVKGKGKSSKDAFITPMAPRNRAPLGMKTTNQKAKGLQTPAPFGGTQKPEKTNRRTSTAQKIKKAAPVVQQAQSQVFTEAIDDDIPDIEYMPPKPKDLPDFPDDITYDTTFPQFRPQNRALGLASVYGVEEVGSDGLTKKQRKLKADSALYDKMIDNMIMKQLDDVTFEELSEDESIKAPIREIRNSSRNSIRGPSANTRSRHISTLRSREAATALSGPKPSAASARSAASKPQGLLSMLMPKKPARLPSNPSSMRNTAATVISNNTLGYSKGRSVSSSLREQSTSRSASPQTTLSPHDYMQLYGTPSLGSSMWTRCKAAGCFDVEMNDVDVTGEEPDELQILGEDEEAESFQLTL
ncbi:hypothetical protein N7495_002833 [Penicillium taxi]|uniref:uncharacterized protein n=1 Tax=Penicillium taxi TaxID=168475 RepID=UPI002544FF08|nr:uncharacterized protein N7495_002833 [Penicillium taxi]KAJ5902305.1 hypothetical protein N7495_002833 [Penicillium taxi]